MAELSDLLETKIYHSKRQIHDCVDTGATIAMSSGVEIQYPCNCVSRDYKSGDALWFNATALIKDSIDDNEMKVKFKLTMNGPINTICVLKIIVPHPTFGDILIDSQDLVFYKNNIDINFTSFTLLYNGTDSEASQYGFKVTLTPGAAVDLKARSILVTA